VPHFSVRNKLVPFDALGFSLTGQFRKLIKDCWNEIFLHAGCHYWSRNPTWKITSIKLATMQSYNQCQTNIQTGIPWYQFLQITGVTESIKQCKMINLQLVHITNLVHFLFAGNDGKMTSKKMKRLKVHLRKLVQQLLQFEHATFRVLRLICLYYQLVQLYSQCNASSPDSASRVVDSGNEAHAVQLTVQ